MYDILSAIYYEELTGLRGKRPMEPPYSDAEDHILYALHTLDPRAAMELKRNIRSLAIEQRDSAFQTGVHFGAQLMAQLLQDF